MWYASPGQNNNNDINLKISKNLKEINLQTVLHLIVWYAGPGQNNNANFDTDVEAGGASEDENQVSYDDNYDDDEYEYDQGQYQSVLIYCQSLYLHIAPFS